MADVFKVLEANLDSELEAIRREVLQLAGRNKIMGGSKDEDPIIVARLEVDLNAVLRSATGSSVVCEVQQTEGGEDRQATEVPRD